MLLFEVDPSLDRMIFIFHVNNESFDYLWIVVKMIKKKHQQEKNENWLLLASERWFATPYEEYSRNCIR